MLLLPPPESGPLNCGTGVLRSQALNDPPLPVEAQTLAYTNKETLIGGTVWFVEMQWVCSGLQQGQNKL